MLAQAQLVDQERASKVDGRPRSSERKRLCVTTRTVKPVSELIRFVIGPNGEAIPDVKNKLPGRGVWVSGRRGALVEAIKRKAFSRGFKQEVRLPADFVTRTELLLERAMLDALAIAGKAGLVAAGLTRAKAVLEHEEVVALLHAANASADGIGKFTAAWRQRRPSEPIVVIGLFTSAQLDLALNRPNVLHAALLAGPASEALLARCRRLERFRAGDQRKQAGGAGPSSSRPGT